MNKSFKKAIACLLAVLMVVFSFPFTALAAPGDYNPDIDIYFGAVTDYVESAEIGDSSFRGAGGLGNLDLIGINGAPIDFDKKTGTLTLKAAKTQGWAQAAAAYDSELPANTEDKVYGVGDYFSVTFLLRNVDAIAGCAFEATWSDNIEPAGIANVGTGNTSAKKFLGMAGVSDNYYGPLKGYDAPGSCYTSQTTSSYSDLFNQLPAPGCKSSLTLEENVEKFNGVYNIAPGLDTVTDLTMAMNPDVPFFNPATGEAGYDWTGNAIILDTVFFKITGEGPISFSMYDPDGSIYGDHTGAWYVARGSEGTKHNQYGASYSPAVDATDKGATKLTFLGENSNVIPTECKHENTEVRNKKEANCTEDGYTGDVYCTDCGELVTAGTKITKLDHDYVPTVTAPTCTEKGYTTYVCSRCNDTYTGDETPAAGHKEAAAVEENKVDATCGKDGSYDEVVYCSVCGKELSRETKTIAKKAHTPAAPVEENRVEPTADKAGSYDEVVYCDVCHEEISRVQKTIEANGVNVTVTASDLGEVEGLAYNVNNLKYGTAYSVTAKPVAGAAFVGWEVNGKLISQSATLSGVAYTDITVTPVFTEADTDTISVIFYDKYANVVAHYDNVTVADFQAEMAKAIPTAPAYPGYVFEKWSMTDDQIKAISKSQTIWATYAEVETGYTVTTDATLTLPENVENGKIPYDAEVTVSAEGATAWVIDGVTVGYGDSYTFFVGSDVTVQPSYEAATVEPKVTIINTTKMTGSHKVNFLATKNVPTGYTLVDYGFVYGKDLTSEELTIENVGKKGAAATAGAVKIVHGYTDGSDQFALNYGIKAQQGTAIAKAYVVVKTADGVKVIYSDASAYNYNA